MPLVLTDDDIRYAERILFNEENVFDDERVNFIKNLETVDLLAVPGSGKTTALLAKLLILSKRASDLDGKGILVLSHTNTAVDLIKEKIGKYCVNLFQPPNFIGTIQSFVNTFLAIPYFEHKYKVRPTHIESELFNQKITRTFEAFISPARFTNEEKRRVRRVIAANGKLLNDFRLQFGVGNQIVVTNGLNGKELQCNKPGRKNNNWVDFTTHEKARIKEWLIEFRKAFWQRTKLMHYDDAYFFAQAYLMKYPPIKRILRLRFQFVFVDEMQDMDVHQIKLLDEIFFSSESETILQRIGDKNQAIFSYDVKLDDVWKIRNPLYINRSLRMSNLIAQKVQPFSLEPVGLTGDNAMSNLFPITPKIIVYDENSIIDVIRRFAECIEILQTSGHIPNDPKHKFKAIGWRKSADDQTRTTLASYYPHYNTLRIKTKPVLVCLSDYFSACCCADTTSKEIFNSIIDSMLRVLALQNLLNNGREFTRTSLRSFLICKHESFYFQEFLTIIYSIFRSLLQRNVPNAKTLFGNSIASLLTKINGLEVALSDESIAFINGDGAIREDLQNHYIDNVYNHNSVNVEVSTVHSVKGETHCATLFLETFFYSSYESKRLINQLLGVQIRNTAGVQIKQSARIVYVGFSRPTHFLSVAIHNDRLSGYKQRLINAGWDIDETLIQ